jgi:hypothetical protein
MMVSSSLEKMYKELSMMYMRVHRVRRRTLSFVLPLALAFVFALSACGTNTSTTTGNSPSASKPTPPATQSQATNVNGCPNNTVVTTPPTPANVTLSNSNSGNTVEVKKGDTIEVRLPFGHAWRGPITLSQNLLAMQTPAGYASSMAKACIWRFVATGTGIAHLSFNGRPICKKGQLCPMYVLAVPFTLDIK